MSRRRGDSDHTPLPRAVPYHVADPTTNGIERISASDLDPTLVERSTPPPLPDPEEDPQATADIDVDLGDLTADPDEADDDGEHTEPFDLLGARTRAGRLSAGEQPMSSFFAPLPEAQRAEVLARFVPRTVAAGTLVIRRGETQHPLVLVARGRLDVRIERDDRMLQLGTVGAGEFVGEIALLARTAAPAHVVAATNAELLELAPAVFYEVCAGYPALWAELKDVAERRRREYEHRLRGA